MTELARMQRAFLTGLLRPLTGPSRARTSLPATDDTGPQFAEPAAQWIAAPRHAGTAASRFELYHRQFWYRVFDSLAEDFPATQRLLGAPAFATLCEAYVRAHPPRGQTLLGYGAGLPAFTATHAPPSPWPVHVTELLALESAYDAAFAADDHPAVPAAALAHTQLALQPHLRLLALRTPADQLWLARQTVRRPRLRPASASPVRWLAVYRHALDRHVERVPRGAYTILDRLAVHGELPRALDEAAAAGALPSRRPHVHIAAWFESWTRRGWLCAR